MLDTIMMMFSLRDVINDGYDTCTHAVFYKAL